jgi:hypothetical protein
MVGRRKTSWLSTDWLLEQFGTDPAWAVIEYERFVGSRLAA